MDSLKEITEFLAIVSACWAIVSGINAWKREHIGKRKIELAEQTLGKFFEIKDVFKFIRNPLSSSDEGKTRKRNDSETQSESAVLDQWFVAIERYQKKENVFAEFNVLKYRFMASYGHESEEIFIRTTKLLNSIFISARMLAQYWKPGRVRSDISEIEWKNRIEEIQKHEERYWEIDENDAINTELKAIQALLEKITKSTFEEESALYSLFSKNIIPKSKFDLFKKKPQINSSN